MNTATESKAASLIDPIRLLKDASWTFFGLSLPLATAVFVVPYLIRRIGLDRFGLFSLAWSLLGYVSLFDMGLGRAITQFVSKLLYRKETDRLPGMVWAAIYLMLALGVGCGLVICALGRWLVPAAVSIPADLWSEVRPSLYIFAAAAPVLTTSVAFRGLLEAHHHFKYASYVRIVTGTMTLLLPAAAASVSTSLPGAVAGLALARLVGCAFSIVLCERVMPRLMRELKPEWTSVSHLLKMGGWMTVSNIINPLIGNADRFLIGGLLTLQAVAYYATPLEATTKVLIVSTALASVLFPAFSSLAHSDPDHTRLLFRRGLIATSSLLFPILVTGSLFSREILQFWLGADFSTQSYHVMQILCAGVFLNALALVPYTLLQGAGLANLTAKVYMLEFAVYLPIIVVMAKSFGIDGVAAAWTIRVALDLALLMYASSRFVLRASMPKLYLSLLIRAGCLFLLPALSLPRWARVFAVLCFGFTYLIRSGPRIRQTLSSPATAQDARV